MDVIHGAKNLVGHAMRPLHAGSEKLISNDPQISRSGTIRSFIDIQSPAFVADGPIPRRYSAEGENVSPPLRWTGIPASAKELILFCEDPDAPKPQPFVHWVLFGLSPEYTTLPEDIPRTPTLVMLNGAKQGKNSGGNIGYMGPLPPIGHGVHHYHFQLFALTEQSGLSGDPDRQQLLTAMAGRVVAAGDLVGTYERK